MSTVDASTRIFFERALREARRYGEDPWVFLRELVQNSRDACADRVEVETRVDAYYEYLICRDNGSGMDRSHIENYLLRLYASTKEEERGSIGFFGVGFWSVLLFQPAVIRVASNRDRQNEAFEIRLADPKIKPVGVQLPRRGTEIVLARPRKQEVVDGAAFADLVRERLLFYAGHVKPLAERRVFELYCNGEKLNRDFETPEIGGKRLKTRSFEGTIGFGTRPSVRLYKGGILVRNLTSLAEVIPSRKSKLPASGWGLYPVIAMNVNDLELLMDRQTVYEDPLLYQMVEYCEREILRLHKRLVRRLFPMNLTNRLLSTARESRIQLLWLAFITPAVLFAGLYLWPRVPKPLLLPPAWGNSAQLWVDRVSEGWRGTIVDVDLAHDGEWAFRHDGPDGTLFRIETLAHYDIDQGLKPVNLTKIHPFKPPEVENQGHITIDIGISGRTGELLLPMPDGYGLVENSLSKEIGQEFSLWADHNEDALVIVKQEGRLRYQVAPLRSPPPPPLIRLGPISGWPPEYRDLLKRVRGMPAPQIVDTLQSWLAGRFSYSREPELARRFNRSRGPWLQKALKERAGDCDVLNSILVLLLRSAGVHAELCVGLVGERGGARSDLHAWGRYYAGGWHSFDLTRHTPSSEPRSSRGPTPPVEAPGEAAATASPSLPTAASGAPEAGTTDPPVEPTANALSRVSGTGWLAAWLLTLLPLGGIIAWRWRAKGDEPLVDEPRYMKNLFDHYFHFGAEQDPLRLQFRPVFPLLGGRRISLFQVRRYADRGRLWGGMPENKLGTLLSGNPPILDRSSKVVGYLESYLPAITWLEDCEHILRPSRLNPLLQAVEREFRKLDRHFRICPIADDRRFRELYLPLKGSSGGRRFLLIGDCHPLLVDAAQKGANFTPLDLFTMMDHLLQKTTFYLREKQGFLEGYARKWDIRA